MPEDYRPGSYIKNVRGVKDSWDFATDIILLHDEKTNLNTIHIAIKDTAPANIRKAVTLCHQCSHFLANDAGGGLHAKCSGIQTETQTADLRETTVEGWNQLRRSEFVVKHAKCPIQHMHMPYSAELRRTK